MGWDYHPFVMTLIQRLLYGLLALCWVSAFAQPKAPPEVVSNSALDGELMFLILLGEMQVSQGEVGAGYSLLLDAARRSGDQALYERAVDVALRARAGDAALQAALAWRQAAPQSRPANLRVLQIQVALQRLKEAQASLRLELQMAPDSERASLMLSIPGFFNRAADKALAAQVTERALTPWLEHPEWGPAAWTAIGQMRLQAQDPVGALLAAQRGHEVNPRRSEPIWLGLELARLDSDAMAWVEKVLPASEDDALPLGWARLLASMKRLPQAESALTARLQKAPQDPGPWLLLGAVRLEMKNPSGASEAWQRFLKDSPNTPERQASRDQALMGLAQISLEAQRDAEAEQWLAQVGPGDSQLRARAIRAAILGRKGQLQEGRQLIRSTPATHSKQVRERTLAEVQYLRQFKLWPAAYETLSEAVQALDDDDDELNYEWAMSAEKVGRYAEAEGILRELIQRNPRFHHAYNALGYSLADRNERLEEARALIVKALEMAPEDPFITDSLGWVEFRMGRLQEAQALLRRAFETRLDAEIAAHWGEVLWVMGQKEQALQIWRQGLQLASDNDSLNDTLKRLGVQP